MGSRRTGKVGGDNSEGTVNKTTEQVHALLDDKANQAGLLLADKFQAQVLLSAMIAIQGGYVGSQTLQMLEQMGVEDVNPLSAWGQLPAVEALPLLQEFSG
jgi:hypothetical protein